MLSILRNRVSIRKYKNQAIPAELLNDLLESACHAANTGNMQTYSIVITQNQALKEALSPCHFNQPSIRQAPVVITFCADFNRFIKWCEQRDAVPGYDNFLSFTSAMIDTTIMAEHFCVAAESQGLGTCYFGTTTYNAQQIIDILKLPQYVVPILTLTVGYPDKTPERVDRLPLEGVVHYETYHDYSPEEINRIYADKESLPENQQYITENHKQTLAQVFTDIRYTKSANETFSASFLNVLRKQGFLS